MALETVMKRGLMAVDPQRVRAPNGIRLLQDTLREASNAELHTDKVQEVLITDFLVSEGDL
jgi:flagellar basal body-associated protein FliL